jgi:hypothetical protein
MKKAVLILTFFFIAGLLFADLEADTAPVTVPVFYPDSDAFFSSRFQSAAMTIQLPSFFFFDMIGDLLYIPKFAEVKRNDSSANSVVRLAGAIGSKFVINDYFSGMAGISFVGDSIYIANSYSLFGTAGLFAHYNVLGFDLGLGVFGGYYWNDFRQLPGNKVSLEFMKGYWMIRLLLQLVPHGLYLLPK